jgi:formate-nitrite transporter family protein
MRSSEMASPEHDDDVTAPVLTEGEKETVEKRTALRAAVVHEAIRAEGETELRRPAGALCWSGLAAGLSMGFSIVAQGLLRAHLPDTSWRPLISNLGYSVGFLVVVLGRQQLFTENTLTVILPLLARRNLTTLIAVARLWIIVLATNVAGAGLFAWTIGNTNIFTPQVRTAFAQIAIAAMAGGWSTVFLRGIFAGWLIATMVWMLPAAESSRPAIVIIMTYLVSLGGLAHVVAGSVDVLYGVTTGLAPWSAYLKFIVPTLTGNVVGGVSLVAFFNHAQVFAEASDPEALL